MSKIYPDISHHHPVTDWGKVQSQSAFLISKATEGTTYVDPTLKSFIAQCEARHIPYWLYTFLRNGGELAQTKFMVSTCKPLVGQYFMGYCLDVESSNGASNVKSAMDYLNTLGGKYLLYTMYAQYSKYKSIIDGRPSSCAWWEARYGLNIGIYSSRFGAHDGVDLHQYTSNGKVDGVSGKIDLNRITGTKPLEWFCGVGEITNQTTTKAKAGYKGTYPVMPGKGYYQYGDGINQYTSGKDVLQIKNVQRLVNWVADTDLVIDGKYGQKTEDAVKRAQKILAVVVDGKFGKKTLKASKTHVK